jgi:hypothetical protein
VRGFFEGVKGLVEQQKDDREHNGYHEFQTFGRLTRTPGASTLVSNAVGYANVSSGTRGRSVRVRIRLQCHDDARTSNAVLPCNALLVASSPWSGLL